MIWPSTSPPSAEWSKLSLVALLAVGIKTDIIIVCVVANHFVVEVLIEAAQRYVGPSANIVHTNATPFSRIAE